MHCCPYLLLKRRKMKLANLLYNAQQHPHLGITMFFVFYDVRKQFYRVKNEDKAYLCLLHLGMLPRVGCVSLFKIHAAALEESCGPPVVVTDPEAMAFLCQNRALSQKVSFLCGSAVFQAACFAPFQCQLTGFCVLLARPSSLGTMKSYTKGIYEVKLRQP